MRQRDVDVLEVVRPRAFDDERSPSPGSRSVCHPSVTNSLGTVREGCYQTGDINSQRTNPNSQNPRTPELTTKTTKSTKFNRWHVDTLRDLHVLRELRGQFFCAVPTGPVRWH